MLSSLLAIGLSGVAGSAGASAPRAAGALGAAGAAGAAGSDGALTAMPAAHVVRPLRTQRRVTVSAGGASAVSGAAPLWRKLAATGSWQASWDRATGVPSRIWGSGLPAPGASGSAVLAETFARAALAQYLGLLAPGAALDDFVLVANTSDGDLRAVGFAQYAGGRRVVDGQVSFRFKRDKLFMIASEALPAVAAGVIASEGSASSAAPRARIPHAVLQVRTTAQLRAELALPAAAVSPPGDEVVLPLVADDRVLGYRVAVPITVDGGAAGRYQAFSDPATGDTLAVRQVNQYATGTLLYHGVIQYPANGYSDRPAPLAHIAIDGAPSTTTQDGIVSWADASAHTITTAVIGDRVAIVNKDTGTLASAQLLLAPDGATIWNASSVAEDDAQVNTYLNVNTAKDFALVLDPGLSPLVDAQMTANVNIPMDCNAFFDGTSVNFFHATTTCENTGRIQDIVYHEFGHAVHHAEVIPGVGAVDAAMSEGAADFFAAQITGNSQIGRGFYYNDMPLRDLDPPDSEARWPDDIGEIHATGLIFGGAFWDLRKALIAQLGETDGIAVTEKLFIGALRRSVDIPSSFLETLAADDDDGDLSNGTPHECAIRAAFGRHGLRSVTGVVQAPAQLGQPTVNASISVAVTGLSPRCPDDQPDHTDVVWQPDTANNTDAFSSEVAGSVTADRSADDPSQFQAQVPVTRDGDVRYQVRVVFSDGSTLVLPDNPADPYYQLYEGRTIPLYCTDFESGDPLTMGWTSGSMTTNTEQDDPPDIWAWGVPVSGAYDPPAAFSGTHALVQGLNSNYLADNRTYVQMPSIDVAQWSDVHLQYRRWLTVQDSQFDQATITVGGKVAWQNASQDMANATALDHLDREWRFHDVPISGYQAGHQLDIAWRMQSNGETEYGGWAIDDVCVVANTASVCGDGELTGREQCDDGANNADRPDACRTWCALPTCGDGIKDTGEDCDDGPVSDTNCTDKCEFPKPPDFGGCCEVGGAGGSAGAGGKSGGPLALGVVTLVIVLRRRRPRALSSPR